MHAEPLKLPVLDAEELRVLGSLMEKSKTTPDYYPLTLNSLTAACNQKTSRRPIVSYDEETVTQALNTLKKKGLVSTVTGGTSRVIKYRHSFAVAFPLLPSEVAIICMLLLRGPQTAGELNANSGRLYEFESIEEIQNILQKLSEGDVVYVTQLPRRSGQKEVRYMHLLAGTPDFNHLEEDDAGAEANPELEQRVTQLEQDLADLRASFDKLMKELLG